MKFVDANVFLRYLAPEDQEKARACYELFQRVKSGDEEVTTSESVIAEITYVLRAKAHYGLKAEEITARLRPIVRLRSLRIEHKRAFLRAFDVWNEHPALDFEDALTVAHAERLGLSEVLSYDRDFDGVASVNRIEP